MFSPFVHESTALLSLSALLVISVLWTFFWKGVGLWHAARNGQTVWFIVILLVNTLGILEIIYLVWFREDRDSTPVFTFRTRSQKARADLPVAESSPAD